MSGWSTDCWPRPRYGERWARHWLDVVRFAESNGFETNTERPDAWPYRDYVIQAFNADKPYDQFVVEQLAGDALGVDVATGFLVAGAYDQVKSPDVNLTAQQRIDELHDMVSATGATFLGLTLGCARCHNHKFDPIAQTDYYAVQAVFAGVQHGSRPLRPPDAEERLKEAARVQQQVAGFEAELSALMARAQPVQRWPAPYLHLTREPFAPLEAKAVRFTIAETADGAEPCLDELEVCRAAPDSENVALPSAGARASASGTYSGSEFHSLEHLHDGRFGNSQSWISDERGRGWVQIDLRQARGG